MSDIIPVLVQRLTLYQLALRQSTPGIALHHARRISKLVIRLFSARELPQSEQERFRKILSECSAPSDATGDGPGEFVFNGILDMDALKERILW